MPTTSKGTATRRRIIDTAWELSDACEVPLLGGVSLRDVAQAAELSPAAVAYHFPTMGALSVAMVEQLCESTWPLLVEMIDALLDQAAESGVAAVTRLAADANWSALVSDHEVTVQRRLARCYAASADHAEVHDVVAALHRSWVDNMTLLYDRVIARLELHVVEPFTTRELAWALSALGEGLKVRWMIDHDTVRPGLFGDVAVALVSSVLAPGSRPVALEEVAIGLRRPEGGPSEDDPAALLAAAERLAPLFAGGTHAATLTAVGQAIGCGPTEVVERYGSLRRVAALSFHRHLVSVEAAVRRRRAGGATIALADSVYELARLTLGDPHCALALLHERQETALTTDQRWELHAAVPLGHAFVEPLAELVGGPRSQLVALADVLVDTTLALGATNPRSVPAEITEVALRLVPQSF